MIVACTHRTTKTVSWRALHYRDRRASSRDLNTRPVQTEQRLKTDKRSRSREVSSPPPCVTTLGISDTGTVGRTDALGLISNITERLIAKLRSIAEGLAINHFCLQVGIPSSNESRRPLDRYPRHWTWPRFILGTIAQRIRISPLVGYLLAGIASGPSPPASSPISPSHQSFRKSASFS